MPSPALTIEHFVHWAIWAGAPEAMCRMIIMSTPMASMVFTVSRSDSPLDTEVPLPVRLIVSAESHLPASSKELRVRVESSKKKLMMVRPRSVGSFRSEERRVGKEGEQQRVGAAQ